MLPPGVYFNNLYYLVKMLTAYKWVDKVRREERIRNLLLLADNIWYVFVMTIT
jgi:hypothetical protein